MNKLSFGEWMRKCRENHGLSHRQLARLCGFSHSHISEIESDFHLPSIHVATLLALHLELDRDEVLLRAGHVPPDIVTLLKEHPHLCALLRQHVGEYQECSVAGEH